MDSCFLKIWSEHFLGTETRCRAFLELLASVDRGHWVPDKWGHYEPIRSPYSAEARNEIIKAWTEERPPDTGQSANSVLFRKRTPKALIHVKTWRSLTPVLNYLSGEFAAKPFADDEGTDRLVELALAMVRWSGAVHASAGHSGQLHRRGVGGTPLLRLKNADWLMYFGEPYVEMFGRDRLMKTPCHDVREVADGILIIAAPRPDSPELTTSPELLLKLEDYLGRDAFAGYGYPEKPCRVPRFDLSETVVPAVATGRSRQVH